MMRVASLAILMCWLAKSIRGKRKEAPNINGFYLCWISTDGQKIRPKCLLFGSIGADGRDFYIYEWYLPQMIFLLAAIRFELASCRWW